MRVGEGRCGRVETGVTSSPILGEKRATTLRYGRGWRSTEGTGTRKSSLLVDMPNTQRTYARSLVGRKCPTCSLWRSWWAPAGLFASPAPCRESRCLWCTPPATGTTTASKHALAGSFASPRRPASRTPDMCAWLGDRGTRRRRPGRRPAPSSSPLWPATHLGEDTSPVRIDSSPQVITTPSVGWRSGCCAWPAPHDTAARLRGHAWNQVVIFNLLDYKRAHPQIMIINLRRDRGRYTFPSGSFSIRCHRMCQQDTWMWQTLDGARRALRSALRVCRLTGVGLRQGKSSVGDRAWCRLADQVRSGGCANFVGARVDLPMLGPNYRTGGIL